MIKDTIIIRDTIYKIVEKVAESKTGNVDVYKEILNSQTQSYNFIIYVFLGIIALFAGATWLYNRKLAKDEIIKHTDKIFTREKKKLMVEFRKEFQIELDNMKGESARLFALACNKNTPSSDANHFYWWIQCVKYYNKANKGYGLRISCDNSIIALKKALIKKEQCKEFILKTYTKNEFTIDKCFYDVYNDLPNELSIEREELIKLTKQLLE